MSKWVIPCPQQAVSSSVLSACHGGSSPAVTSTNNNRFYCWPCQCPLLPYGMEKLRLLSLHKHSAFVIPCSALWSKRRSHLLSCYFLSFCCVFDQLLSEVSLNTIFFLFLSLCSLAAWLRLHLWAGFQRAAVRSSHIPRLQDALSFTAGTLVPRWVQLLSTRGRQKRSHDHRQMHSGTRDSQRRKLGLAGTTDNINIVATCMMKAGCWLLSNSECNKTC